jgi:hypothetical protein
VTKRAPIPLSAEEHGKRLQRIEQIAARLGFLGRIEYQHAWSAAGGAQFQLGMTPGQDALLVFAEAFERDQDPEDFSLEAILAHERGHQLLSRSSKLSRMIAGKISPVSEEVLASLVGSMIAESEHDREVLYQKALFDMVTKGMDLARALRLADGLRFVLERIL